VGLERDDSIDPVTARTVRLAGRDFCVAPLSLRQILAVADYVPKLSGIGAETMSGERLAPLAEILWHGLRRGHPALTRDEFFDLPITIAELMAALPVVIEQAGGRPRAVAFSVSEQSVRQIWVRQPRTASLDSHGRRAL
jgi:hypothetical protein